MRIAFVTTQLPWPPVSGGVIKSWRLVQHWAHKYEVHLLTLLKNDDAKHVQALRERMPSLTITTDATDRPRTALNLLKSYLLAPTLNVYRNQSTRFAELVKQAATQADVMVLDHYEMGQYVPSNYQGKVVLHQHNAEYVMWQRLAEIERNPAKKAVLAIEWRRIARAEKMYAQRSDLVWAAPNDIDALAAVGVPRQIMKPTYHLGEDEMLHWPPLQFQDGNYNILFVGTLTWEANVDGLLWFFAESWAAIKEAVPQARLTIVGKNPDKRLLEATAGDERVHFTGFVDDLMPLYNNARLFIVPLRFGSGIKVKLLNAMYRGLPIVTTPIGIEGLEVQHGRELFYTTQGAAFAKCVIDLLTHTDLCNSMSQAARQKAQDYSWQALLACHDSELEALVKQG